MSSDRQHRDEAVDGARKRDGFTLMELMVVLVILGVLVGLIAPQLMDEPNKARVVKAQMQIESIATAVNRFYLDHSYYPSTEQGLKALVTKPTSGRTPKSYPRYGYLSKVPKDPWQNKYIYISPGQHGPFDIISYGGDGEEGGEENDADVRSWEIE